MADKTSIQWTDTTWNPTTGCSRVSEGCRSCYIERTPPFRMEGRKLGDPVQLHHDRLDIPLHWKKPRRVFVNSLSDLFHEDVPFDFIHWVFSTIRQTPQHTYQILTKRPARMLEVMNLIRSKELMGWANGFYTHVWLGVSVEDQKTADERIPILLQTPAAVRWISAEPLLGPVSLRWAAWDGWKDKDGGRRPFVNEYDGLRMLDWVVVGGESGPKARPTDLAHIRAIVEQCKAAGVPVFVKQLGAKPYEGRERRYPEPMNIKFPLQLKDKKGGDPDEWPADLRVRQFPHEGGTS